ncbi:hypothetical protein Tco_0480735, partial [Tanacetum coccineum]
DASIKGELCILILYESTLIIAFDSLRIELPESDGGGDGELYAFAICVSTLEIGSVTYFLGFPPNPSELSVTGSDTAGVSDVPDPS